MFNQSLEIITIGLPFCAFKILTGLATQQNWLLGLGFVDILVNLVNLGSTLLFRRRVIDACTLSFMVHLFKKPRKELEHQWQDFGNALDVLLSFGLVAYMIGGGHLMALSPAQLQLWNVSVIFNVLGAGYSRLQGSIQNLKSQKN